MVSLPRISIPGVGTALNWLGGVVDSAVKSALNDLRSGLNQVIGAFNDFYNWTHQQLTYIQGEVSSIVSDTIHGVIQGATLIYDTINNDIQSITEYLGGLIHDVSNFATALAHTVANDVTWLVHQLSNAVAAVQNWTVLHVYNPLLGFIHDAEHFVTATATAIEKWAIADIWNPIQGALNTIRGDIATAVNWVEKFGSWAYGLLKGAEHWLAWLATVSFDDALAVWKWITHPNAKAIIADAEHTGTALFDEVEKVILSWLDS